MAKDLVKLEQGEQLCIMCKFGHKCPEFSENDDMLHAVVFKSGEVKSVGAKLEFWTNGCNKFVDSSERDNGDEAGGKLAELVKELKRLCITRRGHVTGMWIPYELYERMMFEAEGYGDCVHKFAESQGRVDSSACNKQSISNVCWDVVVMIIHSCLAESRSNYGVRLDVELYNHVMSRLERHAEHLRMVARSKGKLGVN